MSLTLQGEKALIAAGSVVALLTRSVARGRTDEKFAPFALSRNSSSATYIPACGACGAIPSTIHLIAIRTWKDHCYTSKQFLKPFGSGSLTSRFLQHFLYCGSRMKTKGLNVRHHYVCRERGAFTNIRYFPLFLYLPSQKHPAIKTPAETALTATKTDPQHSEDQEMQIWKEKLKIFTINCSVVQTRTPCRL